MMEQVIEKVYECPDCKDTGFLYHQDENGYGYCKPCKCTELKIARERLERSGLAKEFREKSFENYFTGGNSQREEAKHKAEHYTEDFPNIRSSPHHSMMLCGQVGAGKTHLGTACSMKLINQGVPVIYMGYREEITALKARIIDPDLYNREMNRYKRANVLFIDDFLKGKVTETDLNIIYEIINYRYNNNLPVILSTEKTLDDLIIFDEATASRLIEMSKGHIIVFEGKKLNYRLYGGDA